MNIILCDDEPVFLESLKQKIVKWAMKNGHMSGVMVYSFTSSEDLLDDWQHGLQLDAVFLDIQFSNELNGMALAKEIHNSDPMIPIVFVTSYGQYAEEGYLVNALRYLRKPISEQAVDECMNVLWHQWTTVQAECISFDTAAQILRLPARSILYIEASGHYCVITTTDDAAKEYRIKWPFKSVLDRLPKQLFIQCQRSFAVNIMYIRRIAGGVLTMSDGKQIPMGRGFQLDIVRKFREFYIEGCDD
ncbi:MAG: response regulator transcription factor [Clostridia bacterium]|nr:response regulator transcription factor [Clostridia bacterium]